jgi:hypothetical protein
VVAATIGGCGGTTVEIRGEQRQPSLQSDGLFSRLDHLLAINIQIAR